jgi:hypothetical protein
VAGETLAKALRDAGLSVSANGSMNMMGCDNLMHQNYPGLSFDCIEPNDPLARAIAQALIQAQVIAAPIPASPNVSGSPIQGVGIIIRKP